MNITEQDLRDPRFRDGTPDDYERRDDGAIVRKDRWKRGIQDIACILVGARAEYEIPDIVERVRKLATDHQRPGPARDDLLNTLENAALVLENPTASRDAADNMAERLREIYAEVAGHD